MFQVQGQLHITKRKFCYFVVYTPKDLFYEVTEYDPVGRCIKILYSFKYFNRQSLLFLDANSWIDFIDCI